MSLAPVTREQFEVRSELEVVHIPTGAIFRAHPYTNPGDMLQSIRVKWNETDTPPVGPGDYADDVQRMAAQLLLERAARDHRVWVENRGLGEDEEGAMAESTTPKFEIADDMRVSAERGIEQAKFAFDNYMRATEKAVSLLETQVEASQRGGLEISKKAMTFAENNVRSAFEFANKIVQANDIQEVFQMQSQFVQAQMQILREQVTSLGETITKAAMECSNPGKKGSSSD
jgi:phasin